MKNEKMLHAIGQIDDDLIEDAIIQTAQKKQPFYRMPAFRKAAAIAACLVLVVGIVLSIPAIFAPRGDHAQENHNSHMQADPPLFKEESYLSINSIDMLNYFSAFYVLQGPAQVNAMSAKGNPGIMLLSNTEENDVEYDTPPEGYKPGTPSASQTLIYYELERDAVFTLSKVIFFQIELKDADGFLASKVGTGIVDVVITENDLENMITFRNGDRYYSCCENGGGHDRREFSTHKYVEDFYLVKNLEHDNYQFTVYHDELGNATGITCTPYKNGGPNADEDMSVISTTHAANVSASFTIADLEAYFNTGKFPEGSKDPSQSENPPVVTPPVETADFYTNGLYVFELKSDNTFGYYSVDENSAVYRKGEYSWGGDAIELRFMYEGEVIEIISCDLTGPESFLYNGSEYAKEPSEAEQG